ncbi:MAG: 3-deoxy-D-manno-octulosonic acid transferase [Xanthomonadaceae bacterium]|nr:3-deoxy-D-manno-octulosonic acid transferase [Xanthomonadaceae bacterium]
MLSPMHADFLDKAIERTLRALYSAALYLLVPITVYHLIWRGFRQREYFLRWNERYGVYANAHVVPADRPVVWVHAVSVGEVNAAASLVNALRASRPDLRVLVTTITPTGSARVRAVWGDGVQHVYLPYDLPGAVSRFLMHFEPRLALIMETELWPNLLLGCRDHGVPSYIVNARLSERSLRGYRVLKPLIARALRTVRCVLSQSAADRDRFVMLGASTACTQVTGNLKFDMADADWRRFSATFADQIGKRPVWIAASTHPEEEAAVIAIHRRLRQRWPDLLLLWAPRHPERFKAAMQQSVDAGWRVSTRRLTQWPDRDDGVFVIDTLGELAVFYGCAQVAFVGGSLQPVGGHNLLEPAAAGTAIVSGPHLHNFSDIASQLEKVGALRIGVDADAVGDHVAQLLDDPAARLVMVAAARVLVNQGRGALQRTLAVIAKDLPPPT